MVFWTSFHRLEKCGPENYITFQGHPVLVVSRVRYEPMLILKSVLETPRFFCFLVGLLVWN